MVDDKKNIPDAGNAEAPLKQGETEPVKVDHPVQCQPGTAKTEVPVVESASKVVTPPAAEKPNEGKTISGPAVEQSGRLPKKRTLLLKRVCRSRARTRSRPRSPAWEIPPPLGK